MNLHQRIGQWLEQTARTNPVLFLTMALFPAGLVVAAWCFWQVL
jgi:hypothetical protein